MASFSSKLPLVLPRLAASRVKFNQLRSVSQVKQSSRLAEEEGDRPLYSSKQEFDANKKDSRLHRQADADSGVKPSSFQKRLLVGLGLYDKKSQIPEYVPVQTMQRLHDRTRAFFYVFITFSGVGFYLYMRTWTQKKIDHDRAERAMV